MKTKDILIIGGVALAGFAAYKYFSGPATYPYGQGYTQLPPGTTWNGIYNGTTQPKWVQVTGTVLNVLNSLGQIVSSIPWDTVLNKPATTNTNTDSGWVTI
jgi:hypothetical protein